MFDIGQRVICVNDEIRPGLRKLYTATPVQGFQYIIRDWRIGISSDCQTGAISVLLEGLCNPPSDSMAGWERGFDSDRFRAVEFLPVQERLDEVVK